MMHRRRFLRPRRIGRLLHRIDPVNPKLIEANTLFQTGQYRMAAALFEELAHSSTLQNHSNSPYLLFQAGRAWCFCNEIAKGMINFREGLSSFVNQGRLIEFNHSGTRIVGFLRSKEFLTQANELELWLDKSDHSALKRKENEKPSIKLPSSCTACGAPIHPSEIIWDDENYPICNYCNSIIESK